MAALAVLGALSLSGYADEATRRAYEVCVAQQQRGMPRRTAELFCGCLRAGSNLDMHSAHPAEECAERSGVLPQT